jgi:hypothetical protein
MSMDYKEAFHKECLLQSDIEDVNEECNVSHDDLVLLDETEHYWIIKNTGKHDDQREILNVVWKNGHRRMESIEL